MNIDKLEENSVWKIILALALPTMIGQLGTILYNMADTYFIGQVNDVNQVATISVTMPVFLVLMSLGALFGIGSASYISRMMGSKNEHEMKKASAYTFYILLACGFVFTVLGIVFINPILSIIGCDTNSWSYSHDYLFIIILGTLAIMISNAFAFTLRSVGETKKAMYGLVIGSLLNIALDPIFILYFHMGVKGAAIATVFSNVVTSLLYIYYVQRNVYLSLHFNDVSFAMSLQKEIISIGIPGSLVTILLSFSNIILNNYCVLYGNVAVAAMGIVSKINLFPIQLTVGLGQGIQPLIGYCVGAKKKDKLKETMKAANIISLCLGMFFVLIFILMKAVLMQMFIDNEEVIHSGELFLMIITISTPILGGIFIFSTFFQSSGLVKPSLFVSVARQGLFYIPIIMLGNYFFGIKGVIIAQPISDILCFIVCIRWYRKIMHEA